MNVEQQKHLHLLASRVCDGEASAAEAAELSALLDRNEPAIREYLAFTGLHLQLSHHLRDERPLTARPEAATTSPMREQATAPETAQGAPGRRRGVRGRSLLAIAAMFLAAIALYSRQYPSTAPPPAWIVQRVDCRAEGDGWGPPLADLAVGDEVNLDHGVAMIEFACGAEVVIEGPVRFKVTAEDRCSLGLGKLTASVPQNASGFVVDVPTGEVMDLGTRFGVFVPSTEECETHVFEGRVIFRPTQGARPGNANEQRLLAGEAVAYAATSRDVTRMAADRSLFVVSPRSLDSQANHAVSTETMPASEHLQVWLDASLGLQLDERSRVVSWSNLSHSAESSQNDAWQVDRETRPQWIAKARGGRPAVRFAGRSGLETTPFYRDDAITVLAVFHAAAPEKLDRGSTPIVSTRGPVRLLLQLSPQAHIAVAAVRGDEGRESELLRDSSPLPEKTVVAALVYSQSEGRSAFFINGETHDEARAPLAIPVQTSLRLGDSSDNRGGVEYDLYELLAFGTALSPEQVQQATSLLMKKYDIATGDREPRVLSKLNPPEQ